MPAEPFLPFVAFAILLLALAWLSRQISILIQEAVYLITASLDLAMVILFLVYLPGIVLHEGAHWLMARLLGLRTSKFRVWPKKHRGAIGLGSVSVAQGGPLADSLVGMAPLIAGTAVITWIGTQVFRTPELASAWQNGQWWEAFQGVFASLALEQDGLLWAYLVFAVANAMMPSASDREPLKPLLLYLVAAAVLYFLLDQSGRLLLDAALWLQEPLQLLASALAFTLALDLAILLLLYLMRGLLMTLRMS